MVLRRLPSLEGDDKLKTLAFISAVALKMNNEFVEYEALRDSNRDMPVSQDTLKRKAILAPELMENFTVFKMFKLHKAIPYRVFTPKPAVKSEAKKAPKEQIQEEEVPEIETQHEYVSMFSRSKVLAGTAKLRWMAREMDQATAHPDMTHKEAYRQYVIANGNAREDGDLLHKEEETTLEVLKRMTHCKYCK